MENYSIIELDKLFVTQGLHNITSKELAVSSERYSINDIKIVVDHILNYLKINNQTISNLETFGCGSWMLQFVENDTYIQLHELKEIKDGNNVYEFDLDQTIYYLKSQLELCSSYGVKPVIPRIGQKIAISKEIYDGGEINAVRYNAPDHMSGWYLTSNEYNGDVSTLSVDYLYYILQSRPEIAKFLALPYGYRFFKDDAGEDVWYDKDIVV